MYLGNLTCGDCGFTFTARWGGLPDADEYRCLEDHVFHADSVSGRIVAVDGFGVDGPTVVDLRGMCPWCGTELATGRLPRCPVCGSVDHDVDVAGTLG